MFCPSCGNEMSDSEAFCTNCGWSKPGGRVAEAKKFKIPIIPIVVIVLSIAVVLVIKSVFLGRNGFKSEELMSSDSISENGFNSVKLISSYSENTTIDNIETVTFGSYPQSDESGYTEDPIEWIVLDSQGGKSLLLSKYILGCKYYDDKRERETTWETCALRNWLNNDFYNQAFNDSEQKRIQKTYVINNDNTEYGIKNGNNTIDKIFLLSIEETKKYFNQKKMETDNKRLATRGTNYARNEKAFGYNLIHISDNTHNRSQWYYNNYSFYLRSCKDSSYKGIYRVIQVSVNGALSLPKKEFGNYNDSDIINELPSGVRPAIWVSD